MSFFQDRQFQAKLLAILINIIVLFVNRTFEKTLKIFLVFSSDVLQKRHFISRGLKYRAS